MSIWGAAIGGGLQLLGSTKASNDAKSNAAVAKAENKEAAIRQAGLDALDADYTNQWNEWQSLENSLQWENLLLTIAKIINEK